MRRIFSILVAICLIMALTACSKGSSDEATAADDKSEATAEEQADAPEADDEQADAPETDSKQSGNSTLVVFFSATGNTKGVAKKIADIEGADIYEIKAAQEYTEDDLDWNDSESRTTHEQNDPSVRPEIGSEPVSLDGYTTIYIGYPIWWGEEPRIMDTFVESYDFDGITIIPFCTSSSSGIGRSGQNLADNAGSGNWLEGARFSGGVSEDNLRAWIEGLK